MFERVLDNRGDGAARQTRTGISCHTTVLPLEDLG
jgi:hypothetical protein